MRGMNPTEEKDENMNNEELLTTLAAELARLTGDAGARPERIAALKKVIDRCCDRIVEGGAA